MKTRLLGAVGIVVMIGGVAGVRAQGPAASSLPSFEVASIKANKSGSGASSVKSQAGGRFMATNATLRQLIRDAYQLQDFQIVGEPTWSTADHFDIVAKAPGGPTNPFAVPRGGGASPGQLMERALLADRFKLVAHHESRDISIYALVFARADKKRGPQLRSTTVDCAALAEARARGAAPPTGPVPKCGGALGPGRISIGATTLSTFADLLSRLIQGLVVDHTGVTGAFDIDLTWTPEQSSLGPTGADPRIDPNGPSIFVAVQEQLGLRLESQKGPVDVLVIDHVERPTED